MPKALIPFRPENFVSPLPQAEQSCLSYYILSGCSKQEAFITFCRPDMKDSRAKAAVSSYVSQFFSSKEAREYLDAYQDTINAVLHPEPAKVVDKGSLEERKAKAKTKLVEFAMTLADNIDQADDPEFVLKVADKAGLLEGDEEVEELPRRYLPTRCGECAYRMFCEDNTEDMCQYCKYHAFGEDNGIHYEKTELLDIPDESGTDVAEDY